VLEDELDDVVDGVDVELDDDVDVESDFPGFASLDSPDVFVPESRESVR
jgi:hypothetical protein